VTSLEASRLAIAYAQATKLLVDAGLILVTAKASPEAMRAVDEAIGKLKAIKGRLPHEVDDRGKA
jgi:hypothetical protein